MIAELARSPVAIRDYRDLVITDAMDDLVRAEEVICDLRSDLAIYKEMLSVALEQWNAVSAREARLRETLRLATEELRRIRPLIDWGRGNGNQPGAPA